MAPHTRYSRALGDREPIQASREALARIQAHTGTWTPADFDRSHQPGKWTARQTLVHLTHTELTFGLRVRMALTTPGYVVQPFAQDDWMAHEPVAPGQEALGTFASLAAMNLALYESLSSAERATPITHPEDGAISVDWIIHLSAGHLLHHAEQLERIR
mgnify:FL=1